eukprot:TRINITY_DN112234_c0_g1_i1.p1 TRINITY_DN112234_c0_g1~~TRINITY_DN112234_c0_g1_i1.p1  ORF type:complete len:1372 (-),score=297.54 TRINITY_DN112234_c0_g1_i1:49-4140(-)
MLEPTAIHTYEPPLYRARPPSPHEGPPRSLPFTCVVLESVDARSGPSPALLYSLREQGCRLLLARFHEENTEFNGLPHYASSPDVSVLRPAASLSQEWFPAVFDKVIDMSAWDHKGPGPLERYWADSDIRPREAVCFACSEAGVRAFMEADAGLIIVPSHSQVWATTEQGISMVGGDIAAHTSPTARQLAWLHKFHTQRHWICCLWLSPPPGELGSYQGIPADGPSSEERAVLTSVSSGTVTARGHPPWVRQGTRSEAPPCTCRLDDDMVACPDWTLLVPKLRTGRMEREITKLPRLVLYCHSLDVGVAQVNHTLEVEDGHGLRARMNSRRLVSMGRTGEAATDIAVTLTDSRDRKLPDIVVRSSLLTEHIPPGFRIRETGDEIAMMTPEAGEHPCHAVLSATYEDDDGRVLTVKAWHRLVRSDGRGDVAWDGADPSARIEVPSARCVGVDKYSVDCVFSNPRRGTWYIVEKVVTIRRQGGLLANPVSLLRSSSNLFMTQDPDSAPSTMPEIEEEHRSAWRTEWDRADIEISGTRRAARCQKAVRLYRFHQVSRGDPLSSVKSCEQVPDLIRQLFKVTFREFCEDDHGDRPSALVRSRVLVQDPRDPPVVRIEPKVPPTCDHLRFNVPLGWRWHRFTLTPGKVQILGQGPILHKNVIQLYADVVQVPPKFNISAGGEGVEVRASPWHEVQVQHALTDLGRPDGSTGGFYSLMRRTRFMRVEVVRRLCSEEQIGDHADDTLVRPLRNALARLNSVPRPPSWRNGDNEHLHLLEADVSTRVRAILSYEKIELQRDITFLEGSFRKVEGKLSEEGALLTEMMTVKEAKRKCKTLPGCKGFTFKGEDEGRSLKIHFTSSQEVQGSGGFSTFLYDDGETALLRLLRSDHGDRFRKEGVNVHWVVPEVPEFDECVSAIVEVLKAAASAQGDATSNDSGTAAASCSADRWAEAPARERGDTTIKADSSSRPFKPFRNFVTDRDGTTNNYCDRYASSVQSVYNAAWLTHFSRHCAENSVFITAAPLGGRPSAEGLMELSVAPKDVFIITGSKGREYFDHSAQRPLETVELPKKHREMINELHRNMLALCQEPTNTKFLGIGSGLQRKFGEVTMARNDPAGTVPEPESKRFMAAVRRLKDELDPDGTELDLHDTGTDMEIFPRGVAGRASFDKGNGLRCLDSKLRLSVAEGPNVVCGDTGSDVAMVESALRLMCGDKVVDMWIERMTREEDAISDCDEASEVPQGDIKRARSQEDEAERLKEDEEEENVAREAATRLAVIFVISPEQQRKDGGALYDKVKKWCDISSAHLGIAPSPDVLVGALASYANMVAGKTVAEPPAALPTALVPDPLISTPEALPEDFIVTNVAPVDP